MAMILSTEEAKNFLKSKRHLLSTPNVVSLGFSNEKVDGKRTGKKIFRVGVIDKLPAESIKYPDVFIPKYFKHNVTGSDKVITIPVEVVEEGNIKGLTLERLIEFAGPLRLGGPPYEGGSVIKNADLPVSGCLGANAQYSDAYRLLSAAHALTLFDRDQIGQQILVKDGDAKVEIGATITDQVDVVLYDSPTVSNPVYAKQDLAWANITADRGSPTITHIGIPQEIREVVEGEHVKFFAGQTGITEGNVEVDDINAMTKVRVKDISGNIKYAYFEEVCRIDEILAIGPGDSGTAVVAKDDDALLGLLVSVASLSLASYFCKLQI